MYRNKKFNKYPYIILGLIHIVILLFTLYKKKDRKNLLLLLISYIGFAYLFEYFVVALFHGYIYKPKFQKQKDKDNILGAIFSQFFYVPTAAMFITAFKLGWKVKLLFTVYFALIEEVFLRLGIYKNRWWKTTFTCLLIPLYCGYFYGNSI